VKIRSHGKRYIYASLAVVAVSTSKIDAGSHHFMLFYPVAGYICADIYRETQS
jgi:hypothetical protein